MRTNFSPEALREPAMARAERAARACVHCGICQPACPTYRLLGDELDSPRGRIVLMQDMLERGGTPDANAVRHIDRCLGCLSCASACPSGVDYRQLLDRARAEIAAKHRRPFLERLTRRLALGFATRPMLFRLGTRLAALARPLAGLIPPALRPLIAMAPARLPRAERTARPGRFPALGAQHGRVALMLGCAQRAMAPGIASAAVRLFTRHGLEVVTPRGQACCGALAHHMGESAAARRTMRPAVAALARFHARAQFDAIAVLASGCAPHVKHWGEAMEADSGYAFRARTLGPLARDVLEIADGLALSLAPDRPKLTVAWHPPCTLTHGQGLGGLGERLLRKLGHTVLSPGDPGICCGSAGLYAALEPDIAGRLGADKAASLNACGADVVASANLGCMTHLGPRLNVPAVHLIELLDWATGGPKPAALGGGPRPA